MLYAILNSLLIVLFWLSSALSAIHYVEDKGSIAANVADDGATAWTNSTSISTPCSAGTIVSRAIGQTVAPTMRLLYISPSF